MADQPEASPRGPRRAISGGALLLMLLLVGYCATRDHGTPAGNATAPVNATQ